MKKYFLLLLITISCNEDKAKNEFTTRDLDDFEVYFKESKVISLNSEKIDLDKPDDMIFQSFEKMKIIDNLLIINDFPGQNHSMKIIDLRTKKVQDFMRKGRGPNEMTSTSPYFSVDHINKKVYVSDVRNYHMYDVNNLRNGMHTPDTIFRLTSNYLMFPSYVNGGFVMGCLPEQRFGLYHMKDASFMKKFDYTEGILVRQGEFFTHPSENKAVFLESYSAIMSLLKYTVNDIEMAEKVWWRTNNTQKSEKKGVTQLVGEKNQRIAFSSTTTSRDHIYCLYTGKKTISPISESFRSKFVFVFDWEGNPIKVFILDKEVRSIAFDESDSILYAGAEDENGEVNLYKYIVE